MKSRDIQAKGVCCRGLLFLITVLAVNFALVADDRPNIVIILADDFGVGDIQSHYPENKIATPHLDRLVRQGMSITDAHSPSAVCSPTRYGLLTGRYAWRTRLQEWVIAAYEPPLITKDRPTLPGLLKEHDYHTACIGKWHLGWEWSGPQPSRMTEVRNGQQKLEWDFTKAIHGGPTRRGFDYFFGVDLPNLPPFTYIENDRVFIQPTDQYKLDPSEGVVLPRGFVGAPMAPGWRMQEILPEITRRAVQHVHDRAKQSKPFFLYFSMTSPHEPIVPSKDFRGQSGIAPIADFVMETDWSAGRVIKAIDDAGIADNTIVIFTADNGHSHYTGWEQLVKAGHMPSGPYRGHKGDVWEGGHRVPLVVRWPNRIKAGKSSGQMVSLTDIFATCADIVGANLPADGAEDSLSFLPSLLGKARDDQRTTLVNHSNHGEFAYRDGAWKLVFKMSGRKLQQSRGKPTVMELYDLNSDIAEQNDLSKERPEIVRRMTNGLKTLIERGTSRVAQESSNDTVVRFDTIQTKRWSPALKKDATMDERFQRLGSRFVDESPGLSPVGATSLGDHRFDDKLDEVSEAARGRECAFYKELLHNLDQIDRDQLGRANQVDYQLLRHELRRRLWRLDRLQEWAWNPVSYTGLAGGSIYNLMARDFAPIDQRLQSVAARLEQFPRLYAQIRKTLQPQRVPKVHTETAIKQNRGALSILKNMVQPRLAELPPKQQRRLAAAIEIATAAVNEHQKWLEAELLPEAGGDFRLGQELYDEKLTLTLQTNFTRQQIHDRAASELIRVRAEMHDLAREVLNRRKCDRPASPSRRQQQATIQAALELANADAPGRDEIVATAERSLEIATAFIREKDLVTIPPDPLDIILMPEFKRGVSFAYCDSPGPLEVGQKTFYAVAPLPEHWTDDQCRSFLREYNIRSVHNLTIHEAMPGHFLQLAHANRYPGPLRSLLASGVFVEGWANYTELMMCDEGFLDNDPLMRLVMFKWYLRSIANALLDQAIHVDGLQREAAMELMIEETFQEEREAAAKWTRAQLTSTQLSTYFVGFQEHGEMRAAVEREWGNAFTLKRYHDRALSFGSPPIRFVRALLLDQPIPE